MLSKKALKREVARLTRLTRPGPDGELSYAELHKRYLNQRISINSLMTNEAKLMAGFEDLRTALNIVYIGLSQACEEIEECYTELFDL